MKLYINKTEVVSKKKLGNNMLEVIAKYTIEQSPYLSKADLAYFDEIPELYNKRPKTKLDNLYLPKYKDVDYKCLNCNKLISTKHGWWSTYTQSEMSIILGTLYKQSVLKLKVCHSCYKAYKVFPPSKTDLEKLSRKQIKNINKALNNNPDMCKKYTVRDFEIKSIRIYRN